MWKYIINMTNPCVSLEKADYVCEIRFFVIIHEIMLLIYVVVVTFCIISCEIACYLALFKQHMRKEFKSQFYSFRRVSILGHLIEWRC